MPIRGNGFLSDASKSGKDLQGKFARGLNQFEGPVLTMTREALIRQYLLGNLPADERIKLEDECFAKADAFEELVAADNDLIDSYVNGELHETEKALFERRYLTSSLRRRRVEFAGTLAHACSESKAKVRVERFSSWKFGLNPFSRPNFPLQWASVAAALILAIAGSWLLFQNHQLRMELKEAQTAQADLSRQEAKIRQNSPKLDERDTSRSQKPPQNTVIAKLDSAREPVLTFTVSSGAVRGGETKQKDLVIPPGISSVVLRLPISTDDYMTYEADLQTAEGLEIQSAKGLTRRKSGPQTVVTLRIPSNLLGSGDYIVVLSGTDESGKVQPVGSYAFRAVRK